MPLPLLVSSSTARAPRCQHVSAEEGKPVYALSGVKPTIVRQASDCYSSSRPAGSAYCLLVERERNDKPRAAATYSGNGLCRFSDTVVHFARLCHFECRTSAGGCAGDLQDWRSSRREFSRYRKRSHERRCVAGGPILPRPRSKTGNRARRRAGCGFPLRRKGSRLCCAAHFELTWLKCASERRTVIFAA
jgi:hypothetical protein